MSQIVQVSAEVYQAVGEVVSVTNKMLLELEYASSENQSGRGRILLHQRINDLVHEMMIRHPADNLDRPHRGRGEEKSFSAIRGTFALVLFSEDGEFDGVIYLGLSSPDDVHTVRISGRRWHTIVPIGGSIVFLEVATGPFCGNEFPTWSPKPLDSDWDDYAEKIRVHVSRDRLAMDGIAQANERQI